MDRKEGIGGCHGCNFIKLKSKAFPLPISFQSAIFLTMTVQELIDYYDSHPELREEIHKHPLKYWRMELDELKKLLKDESANIIS